MLTITCGPERVVPGCEYSAGTEYEGHAFFEAPSIRKIGETYYFIYSSQVMHELCYATSDNPLSGFTYGGVIVSNTDLHIDTYKPADMPTAYGANNHGSIVQIKDRWYIFYHRHTNNTWYCRQGCAEEIFPQADGTIPQAEITSCGLNQGPLKGEGEYPAYLACHLFTEKPSVYLGSDEFPKVMQDGRDGDEEPGYVANIKNTATIGFKYFDFKDVQRIGISTRGYANGVFEVKTAWDGEVLGTIAVENTNVWEWGWTEVSVPDGVGALYFTYRGDGVPSFGAFAINNR